MATKKIEKEYISGLHGTLAREPSAYYWLFPIIFFLFMAVLITWMTLSESELTSQATAKIIPSRGLHIVQPKEQGKIASIPIKEGDYVEKGMVLTELDKTDIDLDIESIKKSKQIIQADIFRLVSIINKVSDNKIKITKNLNIPKNLLDQEINVINSVINKYNIELQIYQTKIEIAKKNKINIEAEIKKLATLTFLKDKKLHRLRPLIYKNVILPDEYEQILEDKTVIEENKKIKFKQLKTLSSEITLREEELIQYINTFYKDNHQTLLEAYKKLEQAEIKEKKAMEIYKSKTILSPIDGTVHNLRKYTIDSYIKAGEVMMQILPKNSPLEVEAKVLNKDIGFIQVGQKINFKVDSFPYTKYGYIQGTIKKIEKAAIQDEKLGDIYPAIVELDKNVIKVDGKLASLIPGMTGIVDIQTGKRQMIDYIISPFLRYKDEAMKER